MLCLDWIGVGGCDAAEYCRMSTELWAAEGVCILRWRNLLTAKGARHGWVAGGGMGGREWEVSKGKIRRRNVYVWESVTVDRVLVHSIERRSASEEWYGRAGGDQSNCQHEDWSNEGCKGTASSLIQGMPLCSSYVSGLPATRMML